MNDIYIKKAQKYKYKYLKLKEELYGGVEKNTCKYTLLKNKKANCDRIIYKTNNKITFLEYNVIDSNIYEILKLSDHKMIYGIFEYNNKKYMILSWNMSNFDVNLNEDKQNYIEYYELILPLLRPGGYVILDNVLWSGKVVDQDKNDKDTVLLRKLNALIHDDLRVEEVLLPIRDGLMIARKK